MVLELVKYRSDIRKFDGEGSDEGKTTSESWQLYMHFEKSSPPRWTKNLPHLTEYDRRGSLPGCTIREPARKWIVDDMPDTGIAGPHSKVRTNQARNPRFSGFVDPETRSRFSWQIIQHPK